MQRALVAAGTALDGGSNTGSRKQRERRRATVLISKRGLKEAHSALCMRATRSEKRADCSSSRIRATGTHHGYRRLCKQISCAVRVSCRSGEHFNRFVHAAQAAESVDAQEPRRTACGSAFAGRGCGLLGEHPCAVQCRCVRSRLEMSHRQALQRLQMQPGSRRHARRTSGRSVCRSRLQKLHCGSVVVCREAGAGQIEMHRREPLRCGSHDSRRRAGTKAHGCIRSALQKGSSLLRLLQAPSAARTRAEQQQAQLLVAHVGAVHQRIAVAASAERSAHAQRRARLRLDAFAHLVACTNAASARSSWPVLYRASPVLSAKYASVCAASLPVASAVLACAMSLRAATGGA